MLGGSTEDDQIIKSCQEGDDKWFLLNIYSDR